MRIDPYIWDRVCPEPNTGCWLWTRYTNAKGYGCVGHVKGRAATAHRESYRLHVGPLLPGLQICHACDTPACCNPEHLWQGTPRANSLDSLRKGRYKGGGQHTKGRRKTGPVSERTLYRRARFAREGGRLDYAKC